jgi:hypothetical protein
MVCSSFVPPFSFLAISRQNFNRIDGFLRRRMCKASVCVYSKFPPSDYYSADDLLARTQQALNTRSASERSIQNLQDWVNNSGCISREESKYLWKNDLITVGIGETDGFLESVADTVEDCVIWFSRVVNRVCSPLKDNGQRPSVVVRADICTDDGQRTSVHHTPVMRICIFSRRVSSGR